MVADRRQRRSRGQHLLLRNRDFADHLYSVAIPREPLSVAAAARADHRCLEVPPVCILLRTNVAERRLFSSVPIPQTIMRAPAAMRLIPKNAGRISAQSCR